MPAEERVVYVERESNQANELLAQLQKGVDQQANAILSLSDQIDALNETLGVQQEPVQGPVRQTGNQLIDDMIAQADAIRALARYVQEDQQQAGANYGAIDVQGIDVPSRLDQNSAAQANQLLDVANNQAKALNEIAEITMRLQHQAGIVPDDMQGMQQEAQQPVRQSPIQRGQQPIAVQ